MAFGEGLDQTEISVCAVGGWIGPQLDLEVHTNSRKTVRVSWSGLIWEPHTVKTFVFVCWLNKQRATDSGCLAVAVMEPDSSVACS